MHVFVAMLRAVLLSGLMLGQTAGVALAHGEGPGVDVVPNRAEAGQTVWVYGEDLEPLAPVRVHLLTGAGEEPILDAHADDEGHLIESVAVPMDLEPRIYELRATDGAGTTVSTYLTVVAHAADGGVGTGSSPLTSASLLALATLAVAAAAMVGLMVRRSIMRRRPP